LISGPSLPIRCFCERIGAQSRCMSTYWMLYETRVAATTDKCRAINDSCRNIAVIAAVDVDHCVVLY